VPHILHRPHETEDLNAVGGHCPRCGAEHRPGFETCSDCWVPLLPGPAPSPEAKPSGIDAWTEASSKVWGDPETGPATTRREVAADELVPACSLPWEEAWLMAGRLRADGIPAVVYPDDFSANVRFRRSSFDVIVRRDRLDEARRIVARYTTP
jgi:hypothetical protein